MGSLGGVGQARHLEAVSFQLVSGYLIIHCPEKGISISVVCFMRSPPVPSCCFQATSTSQLITLAGWPNKGVLWGRQCLRWLLPGGSRPALQNVLTPWRVGHHGAGAGCVLERIPALPLWPLPKGLPSESPSELTLQAPALTSPSQFLVLSFPFLFSCPHSYSTSFLRGLSLLWGSSGPHSQLLGQSFEPSQDCRKWRFWGAPY